MFAVYGMTREYAKGQALKHVKTVIGKRTRTLAEYESAKEEYILKMMGSKKVVRVSPPLSTPEVAAEWLRLCEEHGGLRLEVRINHPYKEVVKNGIRLIKRKWSLYVAGRDYQLKSWTH